MKPAEDTPVTGGFLLAKIYEEAGLPAGVLNVVIGPIGQIGDAFTLPPTPSVVSFTDSTRVGRRIGHLAVSGRRIKRVILELGGNAPSVVLDDADIDLAVGSTAVGRFLNQGQGCVCTNRIILDAKINNEFVDRFAAHGHHFVASTSALFSYRSGYASARCAEHSQDEILADCDLTTARKRKTITKHMNGHSEVERDLRNMQTAIFSSLSPLRRAFGLRRFRHLTP